MTKTAAQNRRRNYFIKKRFQTSFIIKFCLLLLLACVIMGFAAYLLTEKTTTTSFENLRLTVKSTSDYILPILIYSSIMAVILVSLATIVIVLFISHRIAGPLYRLERSISDIGNGDLTVNTYLRQADEIKVLAEVLNKAVKGIREPLSSSKAKTEELEVEILSLRESLKKRGIPESEIDSTVKPAEKKIQGIKQALSFFKVSILAGLIFILSSSSSPASIISGKTFFDGNDWTVIDSAFCTIYLKDKVDARKVSNKIDTYRIDYGLSERPVRSGNSANDDVAYKFDLIFFKVQELLDMRPKDLHLNVRIYKGQSDLDRVYMEIFDQQNKFIAFYIFKLNSLFATEEKISANIMAHEIAHCIVDHYFSVTPPTKVAEMIAQYADLHLRD